MFKCWGFVLFSCLFVAGAFYEFCLIPIQAIDDSRAYMSLAEVPLTSLEFWANDEKPFLLSLLIKLFPTQLFAIAILQVLIFCACWIFFMWELNQHFLSEIVKWIATPFLYIVALMPEVAGWNNAILTESLTLSLLILFTAWVFRILRTFDRPLVEVKKDWIFFGITALLAGAIRDSNGYFILGTGFILATGTLLFRQQIHSPMKRSALLLAIGIATFLIFNTLGGINERWVGPLGRTFADRIMIHPNAQGILRDHGAPLDLYSRSDFTDERTWAQKTYDHPQFHAWFRTHGKSVFFKFLIHDPEFSFGFLKNKHNISDLISIRIYHYLDIKLPTGLVSLMDLIFFPVGTSLRIQIVLTFILVVISLILFNRDRRFWIPLTYLLLVPPMGFLIWHACSIEIARHSCSIRLQLRLALFLYLFFFFDLFLNRIKTKGILSESAPR